MKIVRNAGTDRVIDLDVVPAGEFLLYETEDGRTRIECRFADDTLWLSQALIASLFQVSVPTVSEHLKGVFAEGELAPEATVRKLRIVRQEGARGRPTRRQRRCLPSSCATLDPCSTGGSDDNGKPDDHDR